MKNDLDINEQEQIFRQAYEGISALEDLDEYERTTGEELKADDCPHIHPVDVILDSVDIDIESPPVGRRGQSQVFNYAALNNQQEGLDGDLMLRSLQLMMFSKVGTTKSSSSGANQKEEIEQRQTSQNGIPKADESSIENSALIRLGGGCAEQFLTFHVLIFLSAQDLCKLSTVSKYFVVICKSNHLWNLAYKRDFITDVDINQRDGTVCTAPQRHRSRRNHSDDIAKMVFTRANYIERYGDHTLRVNRGKESKQQMVRDVTRLEKMDMIEQILDFIQVRTLAPVGMLSIFLSVVLFCQWEDGLNIPLWACGIPIGFSLIYLMIAMYIIYKVHNQQYAMEHILRGFWANMSGPLVYFYQEAMNESSRLFYLVQGIIAMMIIQIGLVVIKLTSATPDSFDNQLSWGIVFIPIWLLFFIFMISPCTKFRLSIGTYFFIFFVFWVPLFILFACLTQKLDSDRYMRMAHILIPFYVIEGAVMLASLVFLISGIIR
jgi:hypothetical protein